MTLLKVSAVWAAVSVGWWLWLFWLVSARERRRERWLRGIDEDLARLQGDIDEDDESWLRRLTGE